MTKLFRSIAICCLACGLLFLAARTSRAQTRPPDVEQLAKTYGLDSWGQIDAVRYTFNLDIPSLKLTLSRTWTWEPKTGNVKYETRIRTASRSKFLITGLSSTAHPPT